MKITGADSGVAMQVHNFNVHGNSYREIWPEGARPFSPWEIALAPQLAPGTRSAVTIDPTIARR